MQNGLTSDQQASSYAHAQDPEIPAKKTRGKKTQVKKPEADEGEYWHSKLAWNFELRALRSFCSELPKSRSATAKSAAPNQRASEKMNSFMCKGSVSMFSGDLSKKTNCCNFALDVSHASQRFLVALRSCESRTESRNETWNQRNKTAVSFEMRRMLGLPGACLLPSLRSL